MKKGYIISIVIVGIVVAGAIITGTIYNKDNSNLAKNSKTNISSMKAGVPEQQITITKIPNSKNVVVKVDGDNKINVELIHDLLISNGITGVNVDIKVDSAKYYTVTGSDILNACEKQLGIKIPQHKKDLANIVVASSSGLARMASPQNIYELITNTMLFFKNNHSEQGLYMGGPNNLLAQYAPKVKDDDGADSLYVQMCIFLNEYYNNLSNGKFEQQDNAANQANAMNQNSNSNSNSQSSASGNNIRQINNNGSSNHRNRNNSNLQEVSNNSNSQSSSNNQMNNQSNSDN